MSELYSNSLYFHLRQTVQLYLYSFFPSRKGSVKKASGGVATKKMKAGTPGQTKASKVMVVDQTDRLDS